MEPAKVEGKRRVNVVGPRLVRGTNGKSNPNFIRYSLNKAGALLGSLSEQTGEAMRRMNLPPNHDAAIPPKSLGAMLVLLAALAVLAAPTTAASRSSGWPMRCW